MFFIPGYVVATLTFPGVIVHEAAHMLFCKLRGVAVFDVCFFRSGNPSGYVVHEPPKDFLSAFLISIGPLFVNSLLCVFFCFPSSFTEKLGGRSDFLSGFLFWVGVSIGMHAFPSDLDVGNLWDQAKVAASRFNPLAIISFPLIVAICIANLLSVVWFDYFYGAFIGVYLPQQLLERLI
ncbi:MAG TPA: hypothetical protein VMV10_09550 [Pirellulales bacterium]|nr:hypothetical protein [Pirellulales bacterium]